MVKKDENKLKVFALQRTFVSVKLNESGDEERLMLTTKFEEIIQTYRRERDKWYFKDFKFFKGEIDMVDVAKLDALI